MAKQSPDADFDPWTPTTGLPSNFDGIITEAAFVTDARIQDGNVLLLSLTIKTDDTELGENGVLGNQYYSCGKGWEAGEKGQKAVREDGKQKGFNNSTAIWGLLSAFLDLDPTMRKRGNPMTASFYVGLNAHWDRITKDYGGTIGEKDRLLPVSILEGTTPPKGAKAASSGKAAAAASAEAVVPDGVDKALLAKLRRLAPKHDTHDAFLDKAFELDGVEGNSDLEALVADDGAKGLWATARAAAQEAAAPEDSDAADTAAADAE